jgi:glycosyl transferase family 25
MYKKSRIAIAITITIAITIAIVIAIAMRRESFTAVEQNGLNRLDAVIYINLDHRKDRRREIEAELERMGVDKTKIIRFPAVYEKLNGHLGCVKSHIGVMKIIQNSNFRNALILEDDFSFTMSKDETNTKIDGFLDKFGNDWDAIHLSRSHVNIDRKVNDDVSKINTAMTASGYMVNNNNGFYDKLLADFKDSEHKLTKNLEKWKKTNPGKKKYTDSSALNQHWFGLQKKSNWYIFEPCIGKQSGSGSTIMGSVENNKKKY